jgi:chorismate synthase
MASNSWGKHFRLTTFGESHGPAIGGIIDGCPSNVAIDLPAIQKQLNRRKPNQNEWVTPRNENS